MKASNTTESVSMSVDSGSNVFDSIAHPNKEILVDHFRFTKSEDILFTLEMNGEFFEVLCLRRDKKLKKNVFGVCFLKRVDENCVSQDQVLKDLTEPLKEGKNFIFSSDVFDGLTIF